MISRRDKDTERSKKIGTLLLKKLTLKKLDTWMAIREDVIRSALAKIDLRAANYQAKEFFEELGRDYFVGLMHFGNRDGIQLALYRNNAEPPEEHFRELMTLLPYSLKTYEIVLKRGKLGKVGYLAATLFPAK